MNEFIVSTGSGNKVISSDNGSRDRVSRKGETMDWDGIDYEAIAGKLEQLGEDPWGLDFDDLFDLAESKGLTPNQFEREGRRKGRKVARRGSRKGEAVFDSSSFQEIVQYMKDHTTQEILETKFPNADASQMYDAFEEGVSYSDWENTVFPTFVREGDAENKMKQACQSAGIDSSMSSDDWYDYQAKHNLSNMWGEGSPLTVYNCYVSKGVEKVFGCKPDQYESQFTSISQAFVDEYERISKPELTEEEKHKAFLGYMSTFNSNVDGDAIWRDIKDSTVKKGEEIRIYDMIQAMTSDPHYGDKYFK